MEEIKKILKYHHLNFLREYLKNCKDFLKANIILKDLSGICQFFSSQESYSQFHSLLKKDLSLVRDGDRREYGDFQTPDELTDKICSFLSNENYNPQYIIEPTFGKGSFILSSLKYFKAIKYIFGIEIYEKYAWETKYRILGYFLDNPDSIKPNIYLYNQDIFNFNFELIKQKIDGLTLVLGNPPWITNSELSSLNSENLPQKSNLKKLKGLDAITGKGNFDIGECISLMMLENFGNYDGKMAFLIKNSVIKNLVHDLHKFKFRISNIKTYKIDAKKFFNASVESALFTCNFNQTDNNIVCEDYDFLNQKTLFGKFGWYNEKFVSDISKYKNNFKYDGNSPYEWRQGVKHDSSKVFELSKSNNKYVNGFKEEIYIEDDMVYGLIKSSDIKENIIYKPRKYVIITQHYIGESTSYIKEKCPKLIKYLEKHENIINNRKSSIYKNKPKFSIFGIGDYSFKPYKIAISGFYKNPFFSLIFPENNKPLMLDDTCYFLSFDKLEEAVFSWCVLSNKKVYNLLKSISFIDSKRPFTKDILMRIDIEKLAKDLSFDYISQKINTLNINKLKNFKYQSWENYLKSFKNSKIFSEQLSMF